MLGILNGRSTKLDSDDLYSLCELIENYPSDQVVSTPEIVVADTLAETTFELPTSSRVDSKPDLRVDAGHANSEPQSTERQVESTVESLVEFPSESKVESTTPDVDGPSTDAIRVDARQEIAAPPAASSKAPVAAPPAALKEASSAEATLPSLDLSEKRFDLDEAALIRSLGAKESSDAESQSQAGEDTAVESDVGNSETQSEVLEVSEKPRATAGQIIERAKQAAIETAMLAAANSAAMLRAPLPKPAAKKVDSDASAVSKDRIQPETDSPKDESVAADFQNRVEAEAAFETVSVNSDASAKPDSISSSNEQLSRGNLFVEEITSDLAARLHQQTEQKSEQQSVESHAHRASSVAILPPTEKQYERLVDNLLERTVPGMPAAMMFTGCERSGRVGRVATGIAALLAEKDLGRILLIDGDLSEKSLTDFLTDTHDTGLSEVLNRQQQVSETIVETSLKNLYFLPAGIESPSREKSLTSRLAALSDELREEFRFIIIDGGNSSDSIARTWSSFCESTYLVVTANATNTENATTAVTQLQASGARLLGCVVTK